MTEAEHVEMVPGHKDFLCFTKEFVILSCKLSNDMPDGTAEEGIGARYRLR